ncbi:TonB-dependent receptor domain-containing protein [Kerstersia gyiorum]|uniref:TonB-dependent receptor n=1 Tax=Kerstersia gyiorum TaxID=206506 RepID=UPI003B42B8AF
MEGKRSAGRQGSRVASRGRTGKRGLRDASWRALVLAAGLALQLGPDTVQAQDGSVAAAGVHEFDIAPGPLSQALRQAASISGEAITFVPALTEGLSSPGLHGTYSTSEAFRRLLLGSNLEARRQMDGTYVLRALPPQSAAGVANLDAVEVVGTPDDPKDEVYRTSHSVSVLTRDDIERFRGTSVGDIFQGVPGVLVGENRNSGGLDVNIRGMQGQGRVPVLIDGSRQETTVYRGYAGVSSRTYVDPDLIGGVRIDKGPSMDAGGTGAVGGLVSMRTLEADDILRDGESFGLRMRGTAIGNNSGSPSEPGQRAGLADSGKYRINCVSELLCSGEHDFANALGPEETLDRPGTFTPKSWAGSLALAGRFDKLELVGAIAHREQGNYYAGNHGPKAKMEVVDSYDGGFWTEIITERTGASRFRGGERVVNSNYKSDSALLKGKIELAQDQELKLSWLRYRSTYGELMPSQLIWYSVVRQTANSEVTANTWTSQYRWNPAATDLIDLQANLWLTRTRSMNNNYSDDLKYIGSETERYRRWGLDASNTMRFEWMGATEIRYGGALQKEHVTSSPDEGSSALPQGRLGERTEYSAFAALKYKPVESVTLDAGLRYTRFRSNDNKPMLLTSASTYCVGGAASGDCEEVFLTSRGSGSAPMIGLTWEPAYGLQFYARYAEALRMPSLFETTSGFSVSATPDANLKPERAVSREVGINYMLDGVLTDRDSLRLKLAYFRNHTRNYLTRTIPNTNENNSSPLFRLRNIDSVNVNGVELGGSYDIGPMWVEFSGTRYNKIEVCHEGSYRSEECTDYGLANSYINNMIPPNWHASLLVGTRLFDERLTVGMRGTFMGKRNPMPEYDSQGVDTIFARPVAWHAYKVFDLFASYRFNDNFSVDFNIDNITDRYYLDALSLGLVPAPGRTARLSATMQF